MDVLTIRELAKLTKESEGVWRKRIQRKELAVLKLGSNVRVRREDFEKWLTVRLRAERS